MATWQLQDAKARLSEVIETAGKNGPQIITQRGKKTAVVIPFDQWERDQQKPSFIDVLLSGPMIEIPIPPRGKDRHRKPIIF